MLLQSFRDLLERLRAWLTRSSAVGGKIVQFQDSIASGHISAEFGAIVYFNQQFKISAIQMRKLGVFNRVIGRKPSLHHD